MTESLQSSKKIPKNIRILGWVSFFTDISSEMILPILPLFLRNVLKTQLTFIGLIEGIADATASLLKVVSGYWSDRSARRKPLVVLGYSVSTFVKPLLVIVTSWWQVLLVRFADRIGKGVRTSPRDAMIADNAAINHRGRSFGFHRMMDTGGAIGGTLLAFFILTLTPENYRLVFLLSLIPGLISVGLLFLLHEQRLQGGGQIAKPLAIIMSFKRRFYLLLLLMIFGTFANISYAFFILRANDLGVQDHFIPMIYLVYNVVYAALAMPMGSWSDRFGRVPMLSFGYFMLVLVMLGFAHATVQIHAWVLFVFYGVVSAVLETIPRAFVSDMVAKSLRGSGLGLYHTTIGIAALPGAVIFGFIWHRTSAQTAFYYGAVVSLIALLCLLMFTFSESRSTKNV